MFFHNLYYRLKRIIRAIKSDFNADRELSIGQQHYDSGNYRSAVEYLSGSAKQLDARVLYWLADCHFHLKQFERASKNIKEFLAVVKTGRFFYPGYKSPRYQSGDPNPRREWKRKAYALQKQIKQELRKKDTK